VRHQQDDVVAGPQIELVNGRIIHGTQFSEPEKRAIPTAYYGEQSAVGRLLRTHRSDEPRHIGVIGLGVGTLATYGSPTDHFRFYEIIPDVITFAQKHFTFLRDSAAETTVVSGDARLLLEHEPAQAFDILILDAFSGDAIPLLLLTREAMAEYVRHMTADGVLACHISNLHFDLQPVMAGLASEFGFAFAFYESPANLETATKSARWCVMTRSPEMLDRILGTTRTELPPHKRPVLWTDDRSNLMEIW
jgi:spermidine synthase